MTNPPAVSATRVIGIDPGTLRLGWGVLERHGTRLVHVAHGIVRLKDGAPLAERLVVIERELSALVEAHGPAICSIESLFFAKDAQAAAKLGHARGVAMMVCARAGLPVFEYPPSRVKLTVAGHGRADKLQVARMIQAILGLAQLPSADAADALAIGATHLQSTAFRSVVAQATPVPRPRSRPRP